METVVNIEEYLKSEHEIAPVFINRWSPKAMSGEEISREELMRLFEAARWAPSAFNNQPWRFSYAMKNSEYWDTFFALLVDANKTWAKNAAVLIVAISKKTFDHNGKPARTHSYDAGAARENLALQGSLMGLVIHCMQGFDYDKAKNIFSISDEYQVEAMIAVGKAGKKEELPENIQKREFPSDRKKISEIVFEGSFSV